MASTSEAGLVQPSMAAHPGRLHTLMAALFRAVGVPAEQAQDAADVLLWASLHGVDTHGARNLKRAYLDRILAGAINTTPEFRVEHESPITARVDADNGLGLVAAPWAMRLAIAKAQEHGVGIVAVRHSNHFGAAGHHAMLAIPHDMIGVSLTGNISEEGFMYGVVPTYGRRAILSTNPICMAAPAGVEPAFLLDMATSITPMNRVFLYQEAQRTLPAGWAMDSEGNPTTDPARAVHAYPLGGAREMGGHKGYGLGMMVEILCAQLSAGWDRTESGAYAQTGDAHFLAALRVDLFRPAAEFKAGMDAMIDMVHRTETVDGVERVMVAGEPEQTTRRHREEHGIPLLPNVVEALQTLAARYGLPFDIEMA